MTYFNKLDIKISIPEFDPAILSMVQVADVPDRDKYKYTLWEKEIAAPTPLHIFSTTKEFAKKITDQLPKEITDLEIPNVYYMRMEKPHADSTVPPHIDRGRRAAINIYIDCNKEVTEFFEADEINKTLISKGSFVAQPNDVWLLNVSKPHAVRMKAASLRSGISLSFRKLKAEQISKLIIRD